MVGIYVQIGQRDLSNAIPQGHFACSQLFDAELCSFEGLPAEYLNSTEPFCLGCHQKEVQLVTDKEILYKGMSIRAGDCVAFEAPLDLPLYDYFTQPVNSEPSTNAELYPEKYRKAFTKDNLRDCYHSKDLSQVLQIGYIRKMEATQLQVNVFYRPQNVHQDYRQFLQCDMNLLFWTDSVARIDVSTVSKKCQVIYSLTCPPVEVLYFRQCYNHEQQLYEPSDELKQSFAQKQQQQATLSKSLRIFDVFSGCGGLSHGFKPLASKLFALENDPHAARSFQTNFPEAIVFNTDSNVFLEQLTKTAKSSDHFIATHLPREVDLLIGGPPCQGFSEMNHFSTGERSLITSSLLATYLNYVEHYRPRWLLLENVPSLTTYGGPSSLLLKVLTAFLLRLGYQLRVAVLQAGAFGLPQNRRRLFIISAAAGQPLPALPLPTHAFSHKHLDTSFKVGGRRYDPYRDKGRAGLCRMVTVEDAIADLEVLAEEDYFEERSRRYRGDAAGSLLLHYQRMMRLPTGRTSVEDHLCKELSRLNRERIRRIPPVPGADWRDLPNLQ